jgi:hypothetical protein
MPKTRRRRCRQCGKPFTPRKLARGTSRYCSPKCLVASLDVSTSEQTSIHPIEADSTRKCARPECGKRFVPNKSDATEYYCSSECAISEFYRKRQVSPTAPKPYRTTVTFEELIRIIDDAM